MKNSTADLIKIIKLSKAWLREIDRYHKTFVTGADLTHYKEDYVAIWLHSHLLNQQNRDAFALTLQVARKELHRRSQLVGATC